MGRTEAIFTFEGEQLTLKQIQQRVPCLSHVQLRHRLAAGITTVRGMTEWTAPKSKGYPAGRLQYGSYRIDGRLYTAGAVYSLCKKLGFNGSLGTIQGRLTNGENTFELLCRPINEARSLVIQGKRKARKPCKTAKALQHFADYIEPRQ